MNQILEEIYQDVKARLQSYPKRESDPIARRRIVLNMRTGQVGFLEHENLLYSVPDAAEMLGGISVRSVNRYMKDGLLPSVKLGGRRLIPREGLIDLIKKNTTVGR